MPSTQPQETEQPQPEPTREQRLEAALREIEKLVAEAGGDRWDLWTSLSQIKDKCREALTTGEGE